MKRLAGISVIVVAMSGCDTGSVGDDGGDDDTDRVTCMTELSLAGTFVESTPQPIDVQGCWPVGTWSFAPTVVSNDCTPQPTFLPQYQFRVDRDTTAAEPDLTWLYTAVMPADPTARLSVSSGGGGLCSGHYEIFLSADGFTVLNMTPSLQAGGIIDGFAVYEIHTTDQRPQPQ